MDRINSRANPTAQQPDAGNPAENKASIFGFIISSISPDYLNINYEAGGKPVDVKISNRVIGLIAGSLTALVAATAAATYMALQEAGML